MTQNNGYEGIDVVLKNSSGQYLFPYTGEKYRGGAYSLFDPVIKNRVLSYDESQGFAESGSYFYKEALAGTRYGYSTAYQKLLDWYSEAVNLLSMKDNITKVGSPTVTNGVISSFSTNAYATFTSSYTTSASTSFELQVKVNTGSSYDANRRIMNISGGAESTSGLYIKGPVLYFYNGTTTLSFPAMETMEAGTDYILKWVYNGTNVIGYYSTSDTSHFVQYSETLAGFAPNFSNSSYSLGIRSYDAASATVWAGSIDLKQCYMKIDGEIRWQGAEIAKKHSNNLIMYDISIKSTIDDLYTNTGSADMWGIDTANERIFTPRFDNLVFTSGNEYLYYIVGNTYEWTGLSSVVTQGTSLLNQVSSGISNEINTRVKLDGSNAEFPYVTETYQNGSSWYRLWSDGWCEQGGETAMGPNTSPTTVNLLKAYKNTNYNIIAVKEIASHASTGTVQVTRESASYFTIAWTYNSSRYALWRACGYIS